MHVAERTPAGTPPSPDWVSDWWIPADDPGRVAPADRDLAALLAPEPKPAMQLVGRPAPQVEPEPLAR